MSYPVIRLHPSVFHTLLVCTLLIPISIFISLPLNFMSSMTRMSKKFIHCKTTTAKVDLTFRYHELSFWCSMSKSNFIITSCIWIWFIVKRFLEIKHTRKNIACLWYQSFDCLRRIAGFFCFYKLFTMYQKNIVICFHTMAW